LKLNHSDYRDLEISSENLASYPLSGVPVVVDYKRTHLDESNKLPAVMSNHDMEEEEGTEEGICCKGTASSVQPSARLAPP